MASLVLAIAMDSVHRWVSLSQFALVNLWLNRILSANLFSVAVLRT